MRAFVRWFCLLGFNRYAGYIPQGAAAMLCIAAQFGFVFVVSGFLTRLICVIGPTMAPESSAVNSRRRIQVYPSYVVLTMTLKAGSVMLHSPLP